jgi:peptidoglycan/LPS O-acetylase OafA/YrhL
VIAAAVYPATSPPSALAPAASTLPEKLRSGLSRKHLSGLDGLRAVAALMVVVSHAGLERIPGGMGVLAFFVLSGFLISRLMIVEEARSGTVSLSGFYLRRSFRIFPAFYAYFAFIVGIWLVRHAPINMPQAVSAFFYVSNYYQALNGDPSTGLSHTWSLSIEEQFYLLWPLAFLMLRSNRRRVSALAVAIPLLWLYREILVYGFRVDQGYIYEALDTRADHLLIGCFLAVALEEGRLSSLWKVACASSTTVLVTVALLAASVAIGFTGVIDRYRDGVEFVVQPVLFAILIAQLIAFPHEAVTRAFNWRWVRYLGRISYSIYLYQQVVVYPVMKVFREHAVLGALACVCVSVALASASFFLIEQPFLRLRERITSGSSSAPRQLAGASPAP